MITSVLPRNRVLNTFFIIHIVLGLISALGIVFDSRVVDGINPWVKVLKFDLSIALYLITMSWVLKIFESNFQKAISWQISVCMILETIPITIQALRGTKSHFNISTVGDSIVFSIMGVVIAYNTFVLIWVYVKSVRINNESDAPTFSAIRLGLASLILGSAVGGYMSKILSHTVGGLDGGPGLPFLNWSTLAGDLRVAHFFGLHGIQLFFVVLLIAKKLKLSEKNSIKIIRGTFLIWLAIFVYLLAMALQGQPLI